MSKPHLIIIGGRVCRFPDKEASANWIRRFGQVRRENPSFGGPETFGDWSRNNRKLEAMRVKPRGHVITLTNCVVGGSEASPETSANIKKPAATATARMLEAWRTRGPLFGRKGGEDESS